MGEKLVDEINIGSDAGLFEALANSIPALVWVANTTKECVWFNQEWLAFTGRSIEQEYGNGWADGVHPDDRDRCLNVYITNFDNRTAFEMEYRLRHHSGEFRWLLDKGAPSYDGNGVFLGFTGACIDITERKIIADRLLESEERFRTMADTAPALLWVTDIHGNCTFLSKSWYDYTGQTEEDGQGLGWTKAVHPDEQKMAKDVFMAASVERKFFHLEYRLRRKDGTYRWAIDAGQPYFSKSGEYLGFIGSVTDIHERKEVEEDLQQSESRFRAAVKAVSGILWTNNAVGEMIGEQPGWAALTGQSYADYQGFGWANAVHPDDKQHSIDAWNESVAERKTFNIEHRVKRRDGAWRMFHVRAIPSVDDAGNIIEWVGVHTDITEQRQSEEALRASDLRFRQMADSINQMIWVTLPNGYHEYYNKRWYEYTGVPEGSTDGEAWKGMFHPDDQERASARWRHSLESGEPYEIEYRLRRADGVYRWTLGRAECVRTEKGEIIKWYGTCTDIQDLVDARQKAEAANISKSEFLANMSHEIRTPMNAVVGLSHILGVSTSLNPRQKQCVDTLKSSADHLLELINDLLDFAKIEDGSVQLEKVDFNLPVLLEKITAMMGIKAEEKGITLKVDYNEAFQQYFVGDPLRIQQIINNLVSNAIKFTEHGAVTIEVKGHCNTQNGMAQVKIRVIDNGIGISQDKVNSIFDKFSQADASTTRKYGGSGLGLSICKSLVELMHGTINVESEVGKGSSFTVELPLNIGKNRVSVLPDKAVSPSEQLPAKNAPCVLLVEDYPANVLVATTMIEHFGCAYEVAHNGHEAIEKYKSTKCCVIFMDIQMQGMDGFETTRRIREIEKQNNLPNIPIIAMTAHAMDGDKERCLQGGMDDYIPKPFNPNVLRLKLEMYAHKAHETVELQSADL